MQLFTIGYAKKSAQSFFELLKVSKIDVLIDVRLYNSSQLAGFSKSKDLQYFLKAICTCDYIWTPQFAPTSALLNGYKNKTISWREYEEVYNELIAKRDELAFFGQFANKRVCLLCAEELPTQCHRRLLAEKVAAEYGGVAVRHL